MTTSVERALHAFFTRIRVTAWLYGTTVNTQVTDADIPRHRHTWLVLSSTAAGKGPCESGPKPPLVEAAETGKAPGNPNPLTPRGQREKTPTSGESPSTGEEDATGLGGTADLGNLELLCQRPNPGYRKPSSPKRVNGSLRARAIREPEGKGLRRGQHARGVDNRERVDPVILREIPAPNPRIPRRGCALWQDVS